MTYDPSDDFSPRGTPKNCNSWEQWEPFGASMTARLCHGGMYKGEGEESTVYKTPCPSRHECKEATERAARPQSNVRHLPVVQPQTGVPSSAHHYAGAFRPTPPVVVRPGMPTTIPQAQPTAPTMKLGLGLGGYPSYAPIPVVPPETFPDAMQTPYAAMPQPGLQTPTFLPAPGESKVGRLAKNVMQGAVGAFGFQVHAFASAVDFFKE